MIKKHDFGWKTVGMVRLLAVAIAVLLSLPPTPLLRVQAVTITVAAGEVTINPNGVCSLREAIQNANDTATGQPNADCTAGNPVGADTIVLALGSTYTLTDGPFSADGANGLSSITSQITIQGNGATIRRDPNLTCVLNGSTGTTSPNIEFRLFHVAESGNLTLTNGTVSNGCADGAPDFLVFDGSGGGILNIGGAVTITSSTVSDNSAGFGGGIYNRAGAVTITNSTLSDNSASLSGGGLWNNSMANISSSTLSGNSGGFAGGGLYNLAGRINLSNSTVSGNSASGGRGGGVFHASGGRINIWNSTVSGNSALLSGGGFANTTGGPAQIKNSIVANSPSGGDCSGNLTALGVNFDTDGSCPGFTQVTSAQLNLAPLALYPPVTTATHALLALPATSVAIDAATDCTDTSGNPVTEDQRGVPRPQGCHCDVGAYEAPFLNLPPVARCQNVTVSAGASCTAIASIDNGSFDPNGCGITLRQSPPGPYPLGNTTVTLTVSDSQGGTSQCTGIVTVVDTALPTVTTSVSRTTLWPPNHNLIDVGLSATARDNCNSNLTVSVGVSSDEPADADTGDGVFSPDARFIRDAGGRITGLRLRSERNGNGDGRVYLIRVTATDSSGNSTSKCSAVTVARDQSASAQSQVAAQAAAAIASCVPLAYNVLGPPPDGPAPVIGPKQ